VRTYRGAVQKRGMGELKKKTTVGPRKKTTNPLDGKEKDNHDWDMKGKCGRKAIGGIQNPGQGKGREERAHTAAQRRGGHGKNV